MGYYIRSDINGSVYYEVAQVVFVGVWKILYFYDVFISDQFGQLLVVIYYWEFFDFMFLKNIVSLFQIGIYWCGDEVVFGYQFLDRSIEVGFKVQVLVGQDVYEFVSFVNDGDFIDFEMLYQVECIINSGIGFEGNWVDDYVIF